MDTSDPVDSVPRSLANTVYNKMDLPSWASASPSSLPEAPATERMADFPPMSVAPLVLVALLTGCKSVVSPPIPVGRSVLPPLPCNRILGCAPQQPSVSLDRWLGRLVENGRAGFYPRHAPQDDCSLSSSGGFDPLVCLISGLSGGSTPARILPCWTLLDFPGFLRLLSGLRLGFGRSASRCSNLDFNLRGISGHRISKTSLVNLAATSSTRKQAATPMAKGWFPSLGFSLTTAGG